MSRYFLVTFSLLAVALLLQAQTSASNEATTTTAPESLSPPPESTLPGTVGQIPAAGFAVSDSEYSYDPIGKRDPFRPWSSGEMAAPLPIETGIGQAPGSIGQGAQVPSSSSQAMPFQRPVIDEEKYPLLARDVAEYKVVGIVWDTGQPRAMVRDAKGFLHTIRPKSRLGYNGGVVVAVREGEIVVVETSPETGRTVTRLVPLSRVYSSPMSLTPPAPLMEGEFPSPSATGDRLAPPAALRPAGGTDKNATDQTGKVETKKEGAQGGR